MNERARTDPRTNPGKDPGGRDASETAAGKPASRGRVWVLVAPPVVVPGLLYVAASAVPLLPLATGTELWLVPVPVVAADAVFFWVAAPLFGGDMISRYRGFFDPRERFRGNPEE